MPIPCEKCLPSCLLQEQKGILDIWTIASSWKKTLLLFPPRYVCHLVWLDVSLDCLDPSFTEKWRSTSDLESLGFEASHSKREKCLTCPHIFKHSQSYTELPGTHSALWEADMLGWFNFAHMSEKFQEKVISEKFSVPQ